MSSEGETISGCIRRTKTEGANLRTLVKNTSWSDFTPKNAHKKTVKSVFGPFCLFVCVAMFHDIYSTQKVHSYYCNVFLTL